METSVEPGNIKILDTMAVGFRWQKRVKTLDGIIEGG